MTEMDYTQFNMNNLFDIVADPGFRTATITSGLIFPKEVIRKKKIKNLFNF
jgi:MoaA/NifB/PqqE/SkfB family radical SAM enzyme